MATMTVVLLPQRLDQNQPKPKLTINTTRCVFAYIQRIRLGAIAWRQLLETWAIGRAKSKRLRPKRLGKIVTFQDRPTNGIGNHRKLPAVNQNRLVSCGQNSEFPSFYIVSSPDFRARPTCESLEETTFISNIAGLVYNFRLLPIHRRSDLLLVPRDGTLARAKPKKSNIVSHSNNAYYIASENKGWGGAGTT